MKTGFLSLVLHAHLPFVRHPEYEDMMEERWLYEAMTETYIPLIEVYDKLVYDRVKFRITMTLTPPLVNMLCDGLLMRRYESHLNKLIELSEKEVERTRWMPEFHDTAIMYLDKFKRTKKIFHQYDSNLVNAFKKFQDLGVLEIITCCATHGYLPLMSQYRPAVNAQIEQAVVDYNEKFGVNPKGIWLAECAFNPGDDEILKKFGIKYFFTDTHGILFSRPRTRFGSFAPVECPSGVLAFGRDVESSRQVWSANEGYPGDFDYREFYRDIGFDLDMDYIKPYIHETGIRLNTGIKYYRITSKTSKHKEPYNYRNAINKAQTHAGHFMWCRERQMEHLIKTMERSPIVVSPYDAELFGHWWYEGPEFIYFVLSKIATQSSIVKLATPSDYMLQNPYNQQATPSLSSWGHKGYNEVWLDHSNDWIYPHMHKATERMIELADSVCPENDLILRALNQMARELLLLQSSDWAFIMKTGTTVDYAIKRVKDHVFRFNKLYADVKSNRVDEAWLNAVENRDNIFPNINYKIYKSQK